MKKKWSSKNEKLDVKRLPYATICQIENKNPGLKVVYVVN